jgi:hypothetical protein
MIWRARLALLGLSLILVLTGASAASGGSMMSKTVDLNGDGLATSVDAAIVLQYEAALMQPSGDMAGWQAAADVSCDGLVNSIDASLILQHEAGLITLRP